MEAKTERIIDIVKEHAERQEWDRAVRLLLALRGADEADLFEELDDSEKRELLGHLTADEISHILPDLRQEDACLLAEQMDETTLAHVLDCVGPDLAADLLRCLPPQRENKVLRQMEDSAEVSPLLGYEDESAGGLMTPEFVPLRPDMAASDVLTLLRRLQPPRETIDVLFVVDRQQHLLDKLTLRELILAEPRSRVGQIMDRDIISVTSDADREECARLMQRYSLAALPVLDGEGRLVGVIRLRESLDVAEEEATEDMYRMVGLSEDERAFGSLRDSIRRRLPWLCINLGTAFLAGFVVHLFEPTIARVVALAALLPITNPPGNAPIFLALTRGMGEGARRAMARRVALNCLALLVAAAFVGTYVLDFFGISLSVVRVA